MRPPSRMLAIGASWGGVDAIGALLAALPPELDWPIAIVQHRPPDRPTPLVAVLASRSRREVLEPDDKEPFGPRRTYVAPAGYHLLVERAGFSLSVDPPVHHSRPSVDVLFSSAAETFGSGLIAVLLTGANSDDAAGMVDVRMFGGACFVQSPESAACPDMPRAALGVVKPDEIGTPAQLAEAIARRWRAT